MEKQVKRIVALFITFLMSIAICISSADDVFAEKETNTSEETTKGSNNDEGEGLQMSEEAASESASGADDLTKEGMDMAQPIGIGGDENFRIPIISNERAGNAYIFTGGSITYASAGFDNGTKWGSRHFTLSIGGQTNIAYCLEPARTYPLSGDYAYQQITQNSDLAKALYYAHGGPGQNEYITTLGLSEESKYILSHVVAAYFYGDANWAYGLNSTGMDYAHAFINWINEEAPVPDPKIAFSNNSLVAVKEGAIQRTNTVTLNGDSRNYITINLQPGATLHNVTKGTSRTGSVKVYGNDSFYLTAPMSFAASQDVKWESGNLAGSITHKYSPLIFSINSNVQTLGSYSYTYEPGMSVSFSVKWLDVGEVKIIKTSEDSIVTGLKFRVTGNGVDKTVLTGSDGSIIIPDLRPGTYTVMEVASPDRYVDLKSETVTVEPGKTSTVRFRNILKKFRVTVTKVDAKTGKPQGDASLSGAVYGIYNEGKLVDQYTTDANGKFTTNYYICGTGWTLKEITPSQGYLLDATVYALDASGANFNIDKSTISLGVKEQIVKQAFHLIKVSSDGSTGEMDLLKKAGFTIYPLKELPDIPEDLDFTGYDFNKVAPALVDGIELKEMFTDTKGYLLSPELPYGQYVVVETTTPANYGTLSPFIVDITKDSREPQTWRVFNDAEFEVYLKIVKADGETKQTIPIAGTGYRIYDMDNGKYVEQWVLYPLPVKYGTVENPFKTNDEGYLITPRVLNSGNYRIEEVSAPNGYVLQGHETVPVSNTEISISSDTAYLIEATSKIPVVLVKQYNYPEKGRIRIIKVDEETKERLEGAVFEIMAEEDIYTPDGTLRLSKGEVVETITIGSSGEGVSSELYLGTYRVRETKAPFAYGFIIEDMIVTLKYADQYTEVTETCVTAENKHARIKTQARDKLTKTNKTHALDDVTIIDTVHYENLLIGQEYTINGILMDKSTGETLLIKDEAVTATKSFVAEDANGAVELEFTFNANGLTGKSVVVFESIGYDDKTVAVHENMNDEEQTIEFTNSQMGTHAIDEATGTNAGMVREKVVIIDVIKYENLVSGQEYTVRGVLMDKETGKAFLAEGEEVAAKAVFVAQKPNGEVKVKFTIPGNALWGKSVVVFESLYYRDSEIAVHADINDDGQNVTFISPEIGTKATWKDGRKEIDAQKNVTLIDSVTYEGLTPGKEYDLSGVLMDKDTGEALIVDGNIVAATTKLNPNKESGSAELEFVFDASSLDGKEIVVFEKVLYNDFEIAAHEDIDDEDQTVKVKVMQKESAVSTGDISPLIPLFAVLILGGMTASGLIIKKQRKNHA